MAKQCDFTSVGLIVRDTAGQYVLLTRAKVPFGIAPPAGHIDDHGSAEQAVVDEAYEELGLKISKNDLRTTPIRDRRVDLQCSRPNSTHHIWTVYQATVPMGVQLLPDTVETKGARWYTPQQLQELAERTKGYKAGLIPEADWRVQPGLEMVWLDFLLELNHIS